MAYTITVSHGANKHRVEVTGSDHTLGQLQQTLQDITEVPITAQKIIFKGKTLQDESQTLTGLGMKQDSKLILLGRKYTNEQEEHLRPITTVLKTVDRVKTKLDAISEEIEGIEKGFLQAELVGEACRGLHKRCVAATELLMQNMESLDSIQIPAAETLVRGKRKAAVARIQGLLEKADGLGRRIDACRTSTD